MPHRLMHWIVFAVLAAMAGTMPPATTLAVAPADEASVHGSPCDDTDGDAGPGSCRDVCTLTCAAIAAGAMAASPRPATKPLRPAADGRATVLARSAEPPPPRG